MTRLKEKLGKAWKFQKNLIIAIVGFAMVIILEGATLHSTGIAGRTGAPTETTCATSGCHSSFALNSGPGSIAITSNIPASGYVPNTTYTVSVTVAQSGVSLFGFDFESLNSTNSQAGSITITDAASTQTMNSGSKVNVTHKSNGGLGTGTKTFTFNWTSPLTNVGNVTFYAAGNAANKNSAATGDYIYNTSVVITPAPSISTGTISGSPFCASQTGINIPFSATGTYNAGNVFTAQLSDPTGSFATPTTLGTISSTTSGTITSTVTLPSSAGTQYRIRVISNNPAITGTDNGTNLIINLPPTTSNAGTNQNVCGTTTTLAANTPTTGTGTWTVVSGSGTFTNANSPTTTVTGLASGMNVLQWTISNSGCTSSSSNVSIASFMSPTVADAGADQNVCASSTTLAANTAVIGQGTWSVVSGSGTFANTHSPTTTVTGLSIGDNVFQWKTINGNCTASTDLVTITQATIPTTANAGPDQTLCATSATLAANTATVGTGTWTVVSGNGTFTNANNPSTTVTGLGIGDNIFQWTISNGSCTPSSDNVTITQTAPPTISNAGTNQNVCGTTATLAANTPTIGTGAWAVVSGSGTFTNINSPTTSVTGLSTGNNVFQWTISNSGCSSSSSNVTIASILSPTTSNAGTDQNICGSTTTLAANTATVGTGTWTVVSGSGIFADANNPATTVTGLGTGSNVFQWTITNGTCTPSTDNVTITQTALPSVSNAGTDQNICGSIATLAANTPTVGTGSWVVASGAATFANASSPTSSVSSLTIGQNKLVWIISNGCITSKDTIVVTAFQNPSTAIAGTDQTVCAASAILAASIPAPGIGIGTWSVVSGSGTFNNANSPTATVTGLSAGANTFIWTMSNGPCATSSDDVIITQSGSLTIANAGADQSICTNSAALTGNTPTLGTGSWTIVSGTATLTDPTNPTTTVTGLAIGDAILRWTISNGSCTPSIDDVNITVSQPPTSANAGVDQSVCISSTTNLSANTPTTGTGSWSVISGTATFANASSPTTTVTGLSANNNKLVWTISNGGCSASKDTIMIDAVNSPTVANAGADQTVCGISTSLEGNTVTIGSGIWSLISGSGTITNPTSPTSTLTGLGSGSNTFRWTTSNGLCPSTTDDVIITSSGGAPLTIADAGPDQTMCATIASLEGNTPTSGTGTWTIVSGSANITDVTNPMTTVTNLGIGDNKFRWTISNNICTPSTDDITITVSANPTIAAAGTDQTVCGTSATLSGNNATIGIGTGSWSIASGTATFADASNSTSSVTGLTIGQNKLVWTISNSPCSATKDTVIINTVESPTIADAGSNQTICNTTTSLTGNIPSVGTGIWTLVSGTGTISDPNSASTSITALGNGANTFRWTITNAPCAASQSDVTINYCINTITTGTISGSPFCSNTSYNVTVPFNFIGSYTGSFIAELSDASGNFTSPMVIGFGTISPITATIPQGIIPGTNYKIRVRNSAPATIGTDNSAALSINTCPGIITGNLTERKYCSNSSYVLEVPFTIIGTLQGPFTAQLSDASGSFASPITIGYGNTSPVSSTIPSSITTGTGYRIRIHDFASGLDGTDNGENISINTCSPNGVFNMSYSNTISIYPNPSKGSFNIDHTFKANANVSVLNVLGETIYKNSVSENDNVPHSITLDDNITKGLYILRIEEEDKTYQTTLVIY